MAYEKFDDRKEPIKKEQPKKKIWSKSKDDKPNIIIIRREELRKHILAAARSGGCLQGNAR